MKAIGYHFTMLSADMAVNGCLVPNIVKVKDENEALEMAKSEAANGNDPCECSYGCLTVYDDGSVSLYEFSMDEVDPPENWMPDFGYQNPDRHLRGLP